MALFEIKIVIDCGTAVCHPATNVVGLDDEKFDYP